jgi:hypothetical protein
MQLKEIKIAVVFVFFLLSPILCFALDLSWGMKGELLFCGFSGGHPELKGFTGEDSNGIAAGGFLRISHEDILSIQPEIILSVKGDTFQQKTTREQIHLTQFYLELPVLLAVSFPLPVPGAPSPKIFAGPYLAIHLYSTGTVMERGIDINPVDFGVVVGFCVEVQKLFFELSHSVGLVAVSGDLTYDTHFIAVGVKMSFSSH